MNISLTILRIAVFSSSVTFMVGSLLFVFMGRDRVCVYLPVSNVIYQSSNGILDGFICVRYENFISDLAPRFPHNARSASRPPAPQGSC
jgi:hypothetical protein